MKKIISVLLIAVFMLSFVSVNTGINAFAEESSVEVSVTDTSAQVSDEESTEIAEKEDGSFAMTMESLKIMGFGMLGIFIVTGILVCVMYLLSLIKDKQK